MKPITPKERLFPSLAITNPEPRTPKRTELLHDSFRGPRELLLDFRLACAGDDIGYFSVREDPSIAHCGCEVLWRRDVDVPVPHRLEDGVEGG